jgi:glycosyltransferase involved in cell wall biosynthesis
MPHRAVGRRGRRASSGREPLSLCINTQTPLVQLLAPRGFRPAPGPSADIDLSLLTEGTDYRFSPGGVTRMVFPLLRRLVAEGVIEPTHWVALNSSAPATMRLPLVTLHNVALDPERMADYGRVKEAIWGRLHEVGDGTPHDDLFWSEAFAQYAYYNRATAELIRSLDQRLDFDVFYIHDFQQLAVGQMLGALKPKIFRWHIPFDALSIPDRWRETLRSYLASYDVVVVSARRYAEALRRFGHKGRVVRMYPYVDPADYSRPTREEAAAACSRFGIGPEDRVALVVGRMDPIKGQDLAIEALGRVAADEPSLKLVLAGNGSFSGSAAGPGGGKADRWRAGLQQLARDRGLASRVVLTGHVSQHELDCLYERCHFTILPSVREGFGLVVVESWIHDRPAIVTDRAGISELIRDGREGLLFDPGDPDQLPRQMVRLLDDRSGELRRRLVEGGRRAAEKCSIEAADRAERSLLAEIG